ncbi:MAG TPA: hypothetical protein VLU95_05960 [Candidatus Acidoferrum sp.]|nr:hypothetical protein [Candidatus Acidoferrum sp.]
MSKDKIEKDYKKFNLDIEQEAENHLKKIHQESETLKKEAIEIGDAIERSIKEKQPNATKKKVNT